MKSKLPIVSFIASIFTMTIGVLTLIGWFTHNDILRSVIPGGVKLKFNAALCFLFSSIVLMLDRFAHKNKILHFISISLSVIVSLFGFLTLTEYISGINIGIDELFIRDELPTTAVYYAGRTSPLSAINFLMIGVGLLLLNKEKTAAYHFFYISVIVFTSLLTLIGFNFVPYIPAFIRISIPAAIGFVTLSIAIWFAQPMLQEKITFERKLFAGFTAVITLIIIISIISSYYRDKVISTSKWINHTHNVLSEAEQTLSLVNEIEGGGRGYTITGDSNYLEHYTIAKNTVFNHVEKLKELTKDNAKQQVRIDSLSALVAKRIAFSQQCIQLRNEKGFDPANSLIATGTGELYTNQIRKATSAIQQEENNLLAQRQKENNNSIDSFNLTFNVFLASIFILVVIILFSILKNITNRKKDEDKIKKSELRYRSLIEQATDAICIADTSLKFIDMNPYACQCLGYSKEEALQLSVSDIIFEEDLTTNPLKFDRVKSEKIMRNERRLKRKDGTAIVMEITTKMMEDGKFIMFGHDVSERREAEELIRESEAKYRSFFEYSTDGIMLTTKEGKVLAANPAACLIFRMSEEELCSAGRLELVDMSDPQFPVFIEERQRTGKATSTLNLLRKGNKKFSAEVSSSIFIDVNGEQKTSLIIRDITDRKSLEDLLDKATKLARIGSWEVDLVKSTVYWSDITKELHEAQPDFIPDLQTGINFYKEGRSRDLIAQKVQDAIEKGIAFDVELEIITAKGNEKWIRSIGESEFANGKCIRIYGSFQDIDVRKRAELAVTKAFEEKNTILESIGDAFFTVDKNWSVTYWNNQAAKMLGVPKNEMLGHHLWEAFSGSIDSESYRKYHEAIETRQVVHFEDYFDPLAKWFAISAYPSGNGLSVYFKDITDRKLSEFRLIELNENLQKHAKELALSNTELEQFAYVASHDLQEPLRMVTSFLTQLEKKYGNLIDDKGKQYIAFAVDGAKRMRQIILDLLEFSKAGRTQDSQEDLDLNELVKEIKILFRKQIEEKKAVIQAGELPVINAYKAPIRQIFQNLISNALKYMAEDTHAQIQITARESETHWQFAVTDNGIGIGREYFDKIFVIFQRLHNKEEFSGTGMGLAITKKIVENLGGKIWVESKEGIGSTFYFTLLKQH